MRYNEYRGTCACEAVGPWGTVQEAVDWMLRHKCGRPALAAERREARP